jgi:hypothetical protein
MIVSNKRANWIIPLMAALLLIAAPAAPAGAEPASKPATTDAVKKRMSRKKGFLLRAAEDLDRSQAFVKETIAALEEQTCVEDVLEPRKLRSDLGDLRDWYQKYAGWLGGMAAELEADLAEHFSRHEAGSGWTGRYKEMTKGYERLAEQLAGKVRELDAAQGKIEARMEKLKQAVQDRRLLVEKDDLELAKELWPAYRDRYYDRREAVYKDLTDAEVERFRYELRSLGEQQKHREVLTELGHYELSWLSLKIQDSAALDGVARAIENDAAGPLMEACRSAIRTYESDMASLRRKVGEIDGKRADMPQTGTFKVLDLHENLARYYENMKSRYERHIEWLRGQIGSYQADLVELGRDR